MQKKYKIFVTPQAHQQIITIANYIEEALFSKDAADKFLTIAENALYSLDIFPHRYPILPTKYIFNREIRKLVVDKYVSFYFIDEATLTVFIVAFGLSKQDQTNLLQ